MISQELQKKIEWAIGNKIVGNCIFDEHEYNEMLDEVRDICGKYLTTGYFLKSYAELIFVTLVEITKKFKVLDPENEDKGFWKYIFKILTGDEEDNPKLYNGLTIDVITYLSDKNIIILANTHKKYYATLLMHSFAPEKSIFAFFDLCYNVFKKDLDFNYLDNNEYVCELVASRFREISQNSLGNIQSISIGSNVYAVQIGLRVFALTENLNDEFIMLLDDIFKKIHKYFHKQKLEIKEDGLLNNLINKWYDNKQQEIKTDRNIIGKTRASASTKHNIEAKFTCDEKGSYLTIPKIRFDNMPKNIWLSIYVAGETIPRISEELFVRRGEFIATTREKSFELNELLENLDDINLRIEISEDGLIFYKKEFNKQFILFDADKEILSQYNKVSNYFVYTRCIDKLEYFPKDVRTVNKNFYNIYPEIAESIKSIHRQVFFVDKQQSGTNKNSLSLLGAIPNIEWRLDDINCLVFSDVCSLLVPKNISINGLELKIDNKSKLLTEYEYVLQEDFYVFDLLNQISKCEPIEISVYSYQKEQIVFHNYIILIPTLSVRFNNSFYYGDDKKIITLHIDNDTKEICSNNYENEIIYPLNDGDLIIKINYLKWRIDNKDWNIGPLHMPVWYKDFCDSGTALELSIPNENVDVKLHAMTSSDGSYNYQSLHEIMSNGTTGKYEIGKSIFANENRRSIMFILNVNGKLYQLFEVATQEYFTSDPLKYINDQLIWVADECFIGSKNRKFKINFLADNQTQSVAEICCKQTQITALKENVYNYFIKIQVEEPLTRRIKEVDIYAGKIIIGKPEQFRFKNKKIQILSISTALHESVDKNKTKDYWNNLIPKYFIDNISYLGEQDGFSAYTGSLYYEDAVNQKRVYMNKMKNLYNDYEKTNPVKIELISGNTFELIAGYNEDNPDDFLGVLIYDKMKSFICNIAARDKERFGCINFYKFKEVLDV